MKVITIKEINLQFDGDQLTNGSALEQSTQAVDLINQTLQRQPYGLGARLFVTEFSHTQVDERKD